MTDNVDYLTDIHERDQEDAELEGISRAVARHYTILRKAGMLRCEAIPLCHDFQDDLMGGDGALVLVRGDDDE